jgi:hypothetical protein
LGVGRRDDRPGGRRVPIRRRVVAVLLPLALLVTMIWLPRVPDVTADLGTWKLFGGPPTPGGWVAGDGSYPVQLPDRRVAWLFGDSLVHRADGADVIVHNAIVVQDGSGRPRTLAGGTAGEPTDLIPPVQPGTWLWAASGFVESDRLMVFVEEFTRTPDGLGFQATNRRYLVPFQLPDLIMGSPLPVYEGPVAWGHAVLVSGDWVYVYGNLERDGWTNLTYLARFGLGRSGGYWQFWNGRDFDPNALAAAPIERGGGGELVAKVGSVISWPDAGGGGFAALTIDPFGTTIDLRFAPTPQGPWGASHVLYTLPERRSYLPRARTDSTGSVELAYSVADDRPRYLTARW